MNFIIAVLIITIYVPAAGGINGDLYSANGTLVQTGHAACGFKYPFGTVFVIDDNNLSRSGLRQVVTCVDRGGSITNNNLDLGLSSGNVKRDLKIAKEWGIRKRTVMIFKNMYEYKKYESRQKKWEKIMSELE